MTAGVSCGSDFVGGSIIGSVTGSVNDFVACSTEGLNLAFSSA